MDNSKLLHFQFSYIPHFEAIGHHWYNLDTEDVALCFDFATYFRIGFIVLDYIIFQHDNFGGNRDLLAKPDVRIYTLY